MRRRLGRYAAVGAAATAVDVGGYLVADGAGLPLVSADLVGLVPAAAVSYGLHRRVTLRDDPATRWIHHPDVFLAGAAVAGAVDLAVLAAARGSWSPAPAKLVAVTAAATVRLLTHRAFLFRRIRRDQAEPAPRPLPPGAYRLSVVVPAYREADRIAVTVQRLRDELAADLSGPDLEIVVVDDGSHDATAERARAAGADQVVVLPHNRGKGAAVRAGVLVARGRTVAFTDADLSYRPVELVAFLHAIEQGWDVAVGSRQHSATRTLVRASRVRRLGGRVINLATHVLLLGQYRDTQCGIKAFRGDVARVIFGQARVDGFAFDIEVLHLVERFRLRLCELPVTVANSERSTVRIARDAGRLLADLVRVRHWGRQGSYRLPDDAPATLHSSAERP